MSLRLSVVAALLAVCPLVAAAQHDMTSHDMSGMTSTTASSGQAAFTTISEIVRALESDSTTDWSLVNISALREHLVDMDNVMLRAVARESSVKGGVSFDVTGPAATVASLSRMLPMHAMMLDDAGLYHVSIQSHSGGFRMLLTTKNAADSALVARIRGLGFFGMLAEGEHHAMHHMMLARGTMGGG
ncbi:MAG TPA: hypothetical protein VGM67_08555 [Gemmatimonadaceae bacterium]|jgi:hypothetical protein